jgi:multicomponent Na+:H+ antiporter subunit D
VIYVGRVVEVIWFRPESALAADAKEAPLAMLVPIVLLAVTTIWFGIDTQWTAGIAGKAATMLVGGLK